MRSKVSSVVGVVVVFALVGLIAPNAGAKNARAIEGELVVTVGDRADGTHITEVAIKTSAGERFHVAGKHVESLSTRGGETVVLRGPVADGTITAKTVRTVKAGKAVARAASVSGAKRIVVVLFNYAAQPAVPRGATEAEARARLFTAPDSLAALWNRESGGAVTVTGDVVLRTLPATWNGPRGVVQFRHEHCDRENTREYLAPQFSTYDHIMLVGPHQPSCSVPGVAEAPGRISWFHAGISANIVAHELGHNLGLWHAHNLSCEANGVPVAMSSNCRPDYGLDSFDGLGWGTCSYSTYHRREVGWPSEVVAPSNDGSFELRAADTPLDGAPDTLRLPRVDDGYGSSYEIQWVQQTLPNCRSGEPAAAGLLIRTVVERTSDVDTYLVDATPETEWEGDAPLPVGRTFSDPVRGINVTLESLTGNRARVTVTGLGAPSHGAFVYGGKLNFVATAGKANNVTLEEQADAIVITDQHPIAAGAGCTAVTPTRVRCTRAGVALVVVKTGDLDDRIATRMQVPVEVFGGAGNDTLDGGPTKDGPTRFHGEAGTDTVDYSRRTADIKVKLDRSAADGERGERDRIEPDVEIALGGSGDDYISMSNDGNVVVGGDGDDRIYGRGGNDWLVGGAGDDRILAGGGDDVVGGGPGRDVVSGESGIDVLDAGPDDDTVISTDLKADTRVACGDGTRDRLTYDPGLDVPIGCEKLNVRDLT